MREDLHVPPLQSSDEIRAQEENDYTENLMRQHRERLDQITRYYHTGKLTAEQVRRLLEDGQGTPKKG